MKDQPPFESEFDRQIENLLRKRYPKLAGVKRTAFLKQIEPLRKPVGKLAISGPDLQQGRLPFVIVVRSDCVAAEQAMPLIERKGKRGLISMYPVHPEQFHPIAGIEIPGRMAYLLVDIDRGKDTINITPDQALKMIKRRERSPLTIDEGIAILTHYPEFLLKNNCFSLLASRCGDRRVPALWISAGRPRLGWCWAGNPHRWLGSASCASRIGARAIVQRRKRSED